MSAVRRCLYSIFLVIAVSSACGKTFSDADIVVHSRAELVRKLGFPAEIDIDDPLRDGGIGASSFWVYYFEAPGGEVRRVSFAFNEDKLLTNEVLDISLSNKRLRLLNPDAASDLRKILRYKKIHDSDYTRFKPGYHPEICEWIIIYDHKPDKNGMTTVGNHFSIHIDDRTKEASFLPGR